MSNVEHGGIHEATHRGYVGKLRLLPLLLGRS